VRGHPAFVTVRVERKKKRGETPNLKSLFLRSRGEGINRFLEQSRTFLQTKLVYLQGKGKKRPQLLARPTDPGGGEKRALSPHLNPPSYGRRGKKKEHQKEATTNATAWPSVTQRRTIICAEDMNKSSGGERKRGPEFPANIPPLRPS